MNPFKLASTLLEASYDLSTIQIDAPPEIGDTVMEWGRLNVPDKVLKIAEDGGMGRETEQHVTVLYGLTVPEPNDAIYKIAHTTQPFPILVGKVSLFRNAEYDVVKCDVESPWLRRLHTQIKGAAPNQETYPN